MSILCLQYSELSITEAHLKNKDVDCASAGASLTLQEFVSLNAAVDSAAAEQRDLWDEENLRSCSSPSAHISSTQADCERASND